MPEYAITVHVTAPGPVEADKIAQGVADLAAEIAARCAAEYGTRAPVLTRVDGDLRDRIAEVLTREHYRRARERIEASPEDHCAAFADTVMAVVTPRLCTALCRDVEADRDILTGEVERPRGELAEAREENAYLHPAMRGAENRRQMWRERAEQAETKLASLQAFADHCREKDCAHSAEQAKRREQAEAERDEEKKRADWLRSHAEWLSNERDALKADISNVICRMATLRAWAYRELTGDTMHNVLSVITNVWDIIDPERSIHPALNTHSAPKPPGDDA